MVAPAQPPAQPRSLNWPRQCRPPKVALTPSRPNLMPMRNVFSSSSKHRNPKPMSCEPGSTTSRTGSIGARPVSGAVPVTALPAAATRPGRRPPSRRHRCPEQASCPQESRDQEWPRSVKAPILPHDRLAIDCDHTFFTHSAPSRVDENALRAMIQATKSDTGSDRAPALLRLSQSRLRKREARSGPRKGYRR